MIKVFTRVCILFPAFWLGSQAVRAQGPNLTPKERDKLRTESIALVKEFEQLLNVLANKSTTTSDAQDLVAMATQSDQTRIFADPRVVLEDDLYSIDADSSSPKDVSVQKYLNDWDLFYTKGFDQTVSFSDLRVSDFYSKDYVYLKVYYVSQFRNRHRDLDRNYRTTRRVASIRFDIQNGKYRGHINGISFFRPNTAEGNALEAEFRPFVKEAPVRLGRFVDSTITESQIAVQRKSDSLYAEALKVLMQKSEEEKKNDIAYFRAIRKGDSLVQNRAFAEAIEAFTEARAFKPLETYPRGKINELTKMLASGTKDVNQMFAMQQAEGERLLKLRDYEGARQAFQAAYILMPGHASVADKFTRTDKIIRNKTEIRNKYLAGNFRLALRDYAKVIAEDKTNPDWYLERAKCYQAMGETKKAVPDLNSALELDPQFAEALVARASALQKLGDFGKAIADLSTLISVDPKNAEYHQRKGLLLAEGKQYDEALESFDKALVLNPKDVQSATGKAQVFRAKTNLEQALKSADAAIAINPNYSSALFEKGMILIEKGELAKAGSVIANATNLGLSAEEEKALGRYFDDYMSAAKANAQKGQHEEAIKFADKALIVKPRSTDGWYFLALQKEILGRDKESLEHLNKGLQFKENHAPSLVATGRILLKQKNYTGSKTAYRSAWLSDHNLPEASQGMGDVWMALGRTDSALAWYNVAFSTRSSNLATLLKRGKCHYKMENYNKALLDFENAIREDNNQGEAFFCKGRVMKALRKPYDAIDNFNEAQRKGYSKYECAVETGQVYASVGNTKQALKSLTDAISQDPFHPEAYVQRGYIALKKEDFAAATADFQKAVALDTSESNADCHVELGFLYLRVNDLPTAEKNFLRILGYDAMHPRGNYGLGVVQYKQGHTDQAMKTFEQAFQTKKLAFSDIRKDPWMKELAEDKEFIRIKEQYLK